MHPVRQGTSHIVPVVVSAGLAVGVFCGLLFGLGTKHDVAPPSRGSTGAKQSEESQIQAAQVSMGSKVPDRPRPATGSAGSAAGVGSAATAGSAAGSAAGAGSAAVGPGLGKLKIEIEPETAAQAAKVFVDGIQITGTTVDIPFDAGVTKKSVKIVVKVPGYKDMEKTIEVESDASSSISFDLKGVRVTAAPDDGGKAGAGGNAGAGGGTSGGAGAGGGTAGGGNSGGGTGGGAKAGGGGSKGTGGGKGTGKGSGKGSSGLIDI